MQSTGIFAKNGGFYAGQRALLEASEEAWWPLWQQPVGPRWERVEQPKVTNGWKVEPFTAAELQQTVGIMG